MGHADNFLEKDHHHMYPFNKYDDFGWMLIGKNYSPINWVQATNNYSIVHAIGG